MKLKKNASLYKSSCKSPFESSTGISSSMPKNSESSSPIAHNLSHLFQSVLLPTVLPQSSKLPVKPSLPFSFFVLHFRRSNSLDRQVSTTTETNSTIFLSFTRRQSPSLIPSLIPLPPSHSPTKTKAYKSSLTKLCCSLQDSDSCPTFESTLSIFASPQKGMEKTKNLTTTFHTSLTSNSTAASSGTSILSSIDWFSQRFESSVFDITPGMIGRWMIVKERSSVTTQGSSTSEKDFRVPRALSSTFI